MCLSLDSPPYPVPKIRIDLGKVLYGPILNHPVGQPQTLHNVPDQPLPFVRLEHPLIENPRLRKIILRIVVGPLHVGVHVEDWGEGVSPLVVLGPVEAVGVVIGGVPLIVYVVGAVPAVVVHFKGPVDRNLPVVGAQSVHLGVPVGEEASLQHPVR